jgi:hypothetical protein
VVTSDLEEPAVSILCSEGGGRTFVLQKIAGITVYITVFRYDKVVTVLLWKFVNPGLGIC